MRNHNTIATTNIPKFARVAHQKLHHTFEGIRQKITPLNVSCSLAFLFFVKYLTETKVFIFENLKDYKLILESTLNLSKGSLEVTSSKQPLQKCNVRLRTIDPYDSVLFRALHIAEVVVHPTTLFTTLNLSFCYFCKLDI